ncbi:LAGLIDADG family homing endonuclease [Candidatus Woesearchaeota archaeon]|nr:LAGLIDADG family homing endonuclease [Candidatus Woesearchaeota archaeon]
MSKRRQKSTIKFPEDPFTVGYICGFIDGEGCFNITIFKNDSLSTGLTICPQFMIHVTKDNRKILNFIQKTLNSGIISFSKSSYQRDVRNLRARDASKYRIAKINDCIKLAEFLDGKLRVKQKDLESWKKILKIIEEGRHLTKKGILEVAKIRDEMNNPQKSKRYKSYQWFEKYFNKKL